MFRAAALLSSCLLFVGCGEGEQLPSDLTVAAKGEAFSPFRQKGSTKELTAAVGGQCPGRCSDKDTVGVHGDINSIAWFFAALAGRAQSFPDNLFADAAGYTIAVSDGEQVIVKATPTNTWVGGVALVDRNLDHHGDSVTLGSGEHELFVIPSAVKNIFGYAVSFEITARQATR